MASEAQALPSEGLKNVLSLRDSLAVLRLCNLLISHLFHSSQQLGTYSFCEGHVLKNFFVWLDNHFNRGTQQFFSENICSEGLNRLRYSDLISVKTKDFLGETSPQTFVTRELINSIYFRRDKYITCKKRCLLLRLKSLFKRTMSFLINHLSHRQLQMKNNHTLVTLKRTF